MSVEPLVLVPGLNCTPALFEPQTVAFGSSHPIEIADHTRDDTMTGIAARLLADAPERFALAGLSMGGYIALEVMRQAPRRVTRLALLDTNAREDTDEARRNRERLIDLAETGRFADVHDALWPRLVHPRRKHDTTLEGIVRRMAEDTGPEAFVRQQRAIMGRCDSRDLLSSITAPTLVLVGAEDALTPPEQAREMAGLIAGASLVVVPDCGHLSTLERPDAVNDALRGWLAPSS
jgi:pimeloyl-ACP methyl ester carboxylesterase